VPSQSGFESRYERRENCDVFGEDFPCNGENTCHFQLQDGAAEAAKLCDKLGAACAGWVMTRAKGPDGRTAWLKTSHLNLKKISCHPSKTVDTYVSRDPSKTWTNPASTPASPPPPPPALASGGVSNQQMHAPGQRAVPPLQCKKASQEVPDLGHKVSEGVRISCRGSSSCLGEGAVPCDVPCMWAVNLDGADAEVGGVLGGGMAADTGPGSNKVIWSMEAMTHYPRLKSANMEVNQTRLLASMLMQFSSPVPMPYYNPVEYDLQDKMAGYTNRIKGVAFIARNCGSSNGREDLVRTLLAGGVRVDSLSSCLGNTPWPSDVPNIQSAKHIVLQRYLFYVAAENCNEIDYVSEKVYHALSAGNVPIYLGAPNIDQFVPPNSVLKVPQDRSGPSMAAFVAKVKAVMNSQALWEEMVAWREKPLPEWFQRRFSFTCTHSSCRLCRYVYARKHNLPWNHELQRIEWEGYKADYNPCDQRTSLHVDSTQCNKA